MLARNHSLYVFQISPRNVFNMRADTSFMSGRIKNFKDLCHLIVHCFAVIHNDIATIIIRILRRIVNGRCFNPPCCAELDWIGIGQISSRIDECFLDKKSSKFIAAVVFKIAIQSCLLQTFIT